MSEEKFKEWGILELMGHRRLAGLISEQQIGGASFIRIDVPNPGPGPLFEGASPFRATQFYGAAAIYCITPTDEETARKAALLVEVAPVRRWELPGPEQPDREEF